mgnify:FL=1
MKMREWAFAVSAVAGLLAGTALGAAPAKPSPASCAKCHKAAAAAISAPGGAHAGLACADCHGEAHPPKGEQKAPSCAGCHEGHGKEMAAADCARCHTAHRPREVRYGLDVPSKQCGACHAGALAALEATKSRHKPLRCVICHQKEHRVTQGCAHCHGSPHGSDAVRADGPCASCHGPAHDLGKVAAKTKG